MDTLTIKSPSFEDNGFMPKKHTGFGEDVSPAFNLFNLSDKAVSLAIIMDDLDIPFISAYNHWLLWNIPPMEEIPENIPYGTGTRTGAGTLGNAVQGIGYGKHRYRGPKQPVFIRNTHRYVFNFYVLDCYFELDCNSTKKELLAKMQGHVLQQGSITGKYKR